MTLHDLAEFAHWWTTSRVGAAAAGVGAFAGALAAGVGIRTFAQTRRDSKARSRPMVAAELRSVPHVRSQSLVIRNYGPSVARNLKVTFDPPIAQPENPAGLATPFMLVRYERPISVMTPGMELDNLYYVGQPGPDGDIVNSEPTPDRVNVVLTYENDAGDDFQDVFELDVDTIRKRTWVTSSAAPEALMKQSAGHLKGIEGLPSRPSLRR